MAKTSTLRIPIDAKLKAEGMAALASTGVTASEAVRILFARIVAEGALPSELRPAAMNETNLD